MKVRRQEKPWGYELLIAWTDAYAGKILCIRAGHRLSLHHHELKDETLFALEGEIELEIASYQPYRCRMLPGRSYRVHPGERHRLTARSDARVLEISTPELDDVVRCEDDYGRAPAPAARRPPAAP